MKPTLREIYRSWRYHRAIRSSLRRNQRQLKRAQARRHEHNLVVFGAEKGTLIGRCTICGQTEELLTATH